MFCGKVGDGTTSVVIVAAELLRRGNELIKNKVHPTAIISGYRLALKEVSPLPIRRCMYLTPHPDCRPSDHPLLPPPYRR